MNRDQKAAVIDEIAAEITASQAVYAVDYRGMTVPQAAEIRTKLRANDSSFRVVKNSLTERAADKAGAEELKELLQGPTALVLVRGDAATAAKVMSDFTRATELAPFKGGRLDGEALNVDQIKSIAQLPTREVLYGQLVGLIASPITGLARGLNALLSGVAVALGQVHAKAEAGEIQLGGGAAPTGPAEDEPGPAAVAEPATEEAPGAAATDAAPGTDTSDEAAPAADASPEEPAEGAEVTTLSDSQEDNE